MKTYLAAVLAIGASAWKAADYSKHRQLLGDYQPIMRPLLELADDPVNNGYGPTYTEETRAERITDRQGWNKLFTNRGLETYTHAHFGDDANDDDPADHHHLYPAEHKHYREVDFKDRHNVIVDQDRIVYHVTPTRYVAEYEEEEPEEGYVKDYFFPSMKPDNLWQGKKDTWDCEDGWGRYCGYKNPFGKHDGVGNLNPSFGG